MSGIEKRRKKINKVATSGLSRQAPVRNPPPEHKFVVKGPRSHPGSIYVGRGSKWGNPYVIGKDGTRREVIEKYAQWIREGNKEAEIREELKGKILACWCHPLPCHAHLLARIANFPSQSTMDRFLTRTSLPTSP